jgi:hypothetical protein
MRGKLRVILVSRDLLGSSSELPRGLALRVLFPPDVYPWLKRSRRAVLFHPLHIDPALRTFGKIVESAQNGAASLLKTLNAAAAFRCALFTVVRYLLRKTLLK